MSALIRRIKLLPLYVDVVRRLGIGWVLFRIRYALELRTGVHVRRSPMKPWPVSIPTSDRPPSVISPETLAPWLREHYTDEQKAELQQHVDDLRVRRFDVFGTKVDLASWHDDPYSGVTYPRGLHWSRVPEFEEADIKRVWEPSRFGWVFDLVRAHHLLPESGAGELFWELFGEWCEQNPPNEGVNWKCGQEASIRLMAITCAVQGMPETLTDTRAGMIRTFAEVTGARVESNIAYARSQKNNHHASEAVGLLTAGYWTGERIGQRRIKLGLHHMIDVSETLIFSDGGSSQYSLNYHRVFVHNLMWAVLLIETLPSLVPTEIAGALERAAGFMAAMVEPISGEAPFFGPDDGTRLLPLDRVTHRHLNEDALVALAVGAPTKMPAGLKAMQVEGTHWFDKQGPSETDDKIPEVVARSFPDMGIHLLAVGANRAYVRCGSYRFRPHEEDQLHCDIWVHGSNIAPDAGTGSYKPQDGQTAKGDTVAEHNSVSCSGKGQMQHLGRFLWARWPTGIGRVSGEPLRATGQFTASRFGVYSLNRRVSITPGEIRVTDSEDFGRPLEIRWNLSSDSLPEVSSPNPTSVIVRPASLRSLGYGTGQLSVQLAASGLGPISAVFCPTLPGPRT